MADKRVLIVDDIPQVRHELHTLLHLSGGVQVIGEAADGAEAIRLALQLEPDVVLLDLEMPVLDGYCAALQIKAQLPRCRVLALSIHEDALSREKARQAGIDVFIPKGASPRELLDAVQHSANSPQSFESQEGEQL
jgi:DNA-binding NarL/FixJ family response regulator